MTIRTVGAALVAASMAACNGVNPEPDFALYPKRLEIAPVAWSDSDTKWYSVSILNQTFFELTLSDIEVTEAGSTFLDLRLPTSTRLGLRESVDIGVRVMDPATSGTNGWSTGEYDAELFFRVSGTGKIDPETSLPDPGAIETIDQTVPIRITLECDIDGDGSDATACGGNDCDDTLAAVGPDATELCDGFDNDCNNVVDDDCVDE
ncbi:MAG: putative metal-binding motif-containing protein [Alphaproteobacteria bacterium]|nr:putative metal-binding motif-containing protein [Alphaproteobacteria bacterium]